MKRNREHSTKLLLQAYYYNTIVIFFQRFCVEFNARLAYATICSSSSLSWARTALTARLDASV